MPRGFVTCTRADPSPRLGAATVDLFPIAGVLSPSCALAHRWRSKYGKFHRPAKNETTVAPFGKELCVVHIHTEPAFNGSAAVVDRLERFRRDSGYFPRSTALLHTMLYGEGPAV